MMRMAPAILSRQIAAATRLAGWSGGFFRSKIDRKSLFNADSNKYSAAAELKAAIEFQSTN
jgi:hypothetical protein